MTKCYVHHKIFLGQNIKSVDEDLLKQQENHPRVWNKSLLDTFWWIVYDIDTVLIRVVLTLGLLSHSGCWLENLLLFIWKRIRQNYTVISSYGCKAGKKLKANWVLPLRHQLIRNNCFSSMITFSCRSDEKLCSENGSPPCTGSVLQYCFSFIKLYS